MQDYETTDELHISVRRRQDRRTDLYLGAADLDGLVHTSVQRTYGPEIELGEVASDVCRLACAWGAWGILGVEEVRDALRGADRY